MNIKYQYVLQYEIKKNNRVKRSRVGDPTPEDS